MSHHPEFQIKLRYHLERKGVFSEERESITYDDLRSENLPYLEAVVLEILRISQVALFVSRMASCDTQILGYFIPKGTEIVLHIGYAGLQNAKPCGKNSINRCPVRYRSGATKPLWHGDGEIFNPDRWLDGHGAFNPNAGLAFPFGAGPRKCYGYKLAVSGRSSPWRVSHKLVSDLTDEARFGGDQS